MAAYWGIPSRWWLRISRYNGTTVSRSHPGSWCVVCRANPGSNCLLFILHVRFFLVVLYKSCKCATARCAKRCQKNSTRPIQQSLSHRCLLQSTAVSQQLAALEVLIQNGAIAKADDCPKGLQRWDAKGKGAVLAGFVSTLGKTFVLWWNARVAVALALAELIVELGSISDFLTIWSKLCDSEALGLKIQQCSFVCEN